MFTGHCITLAIKSNGIVIGFTEQEKTRVRENYNYIVLLK